MTKIEQLVREWRADEDLPEDWRTRFQQLDDHDAWVVLRSIAPH